MKIMAAKDVPVRLTLESGYPVWYTEEGIVQVHRLIAIANGEDPHKVFSGNYHCHHQSGFRCDNRHGNIELLTEKEHMQIHVERGDITPPPQETELTKPLLKELYIDRGMSYPEIAEVTDHSEGRVRHWVREYGLRWDLYWQSE